MTHVPWKLCANCGCACPRDATRCRQCDGWFPPPSPPGGASPLLCLALICAIVGGLGAWAAWLWRGDLRSALAPRVSPAASAAVADIQIDWLWTQGIVTSGSITNLSPYPIEGLAITFDDAQIIEDQGFALGVNHRRLAARIQHDGPLAPGDNCNFFVMKSISLLPPPDMEVSCGTTNPNAPIIIRVHQKRWDSREGLVPVE